jgi:hypothetical protein
MTYAVCLSFLIVMILTGCSSPTAPTAEPSPPSPTPAPAATTALSLPTLNPAVMLLQPNQDYSIFITFSESSGNTVTIQDDVAVETVATFKLENLTGDPEHPHFALSKEITGIEWGMPYVMYALNVQAAAWDRPYASIQGVLILSPDGQRLVYSLCNEYGGRGQFCSASRLWLFNTQTGEGRQLNLADSGLIFAYNPVFSDDSQTLTSEGCLSYANAYFGYCGVTAVATWGLTTGKLLDVVVTATRTP